MLDNVESVSRGYIELAKHLPAQNEELYHFDIPCTVHNQTTLFAAAGFENIEEVWHEKNTAIIVSARPGSVSNVDY